MVLESIPMLTVSYLLIIVGTIFLGLGYYLKRQENEYSSYILTIGGILVIIGLIIIGKFISGFR